MTSEEWFAQISGQVEALVLAYASLAATHQDPSSVVGLLGELTKKASTQASDSPQQAAYKAGTRAAVSQLLSAVELARTTRLLDAKQKH